MVNNTAANPISAFNLLSATAAEFKQLVADFTEWAKAQESLPPLTFTDGWTVVTPEQALNFLCHTVVHGGNRKVSFDTVLYYAEQMRTKDWRKTGQPLITDTAGNGDDGQHRCWASVLSNSSFPTYVVASVEPFDNLFAYIDNSKPRNAADALETAGLNGHARIAASVVRLALRYDAGVLAPTSKGKIPKASPMEVLRYIGTHDGIREAINLMTSEYGEIMPLMLKRDIAVFVGWKILEHHGEDILDEFMRGLMAADASAPNAAGDPLVALRKKLEAYADNDANAGRIIGGKKQKKTPWVQTLAHIVKAFNAWHNHEAMKTVSVRVDEEFPRFTDTTEEAVAA